MEFTLTETQKEKFETWKKENGLEAKGPMGGVFTFSFIPTTVVTFVKVKHTRGLEIDLTDYDSF